MPEEDREGQIDRSARPPIDPPTYEEALHSLGRVPTVADLVPIAQAPALPPWYPMKLGRTATLRKTRTHRRGPLSEWKLKNLPWLKPLQKRVWELLWGLDHCQEGNS